MPPATTKVSLLRSAQKILPLCSAQKVSLLRSAEKVSLPRPASKRMEAEAFLRRNPIPRSAHLPAEIV